MDPAREIPGSTSTPKILVLVLAVDREPWRSLEGLTHPSTWGSSADPRVTVRRYVGASRRLPTGMLSSLNVRLDRTKLGITFSSQRYAIWNRAINSRLPSCRETPPNTIRVALPDTYWLIGAKTLAAFRFALAHYAFDYLMRTNISSYVDLPNLVAQVSGYPARGLYAGYPGSSNNCSEFVSGSGYLLSRDLVEAVVSSQRLWEHQFIDDVALSRLLARIGVGHPVTPVRRLEVGGEREAASLSDSDLRSCFHFRCKSQIPENQIRAMRRIHSRFAEMRGQD